MWSHISRRDRLPPTAQTPPAHAMIVIEKKNKIQAETDHETRGDTKRGGAGRSAITRNNRGEDHTHKRQTKESGVRAHTVLCKEKEARFFRPLSVNQRYSRRPTPTYLGRKKNRKKVLRDDVAHARPQCRDGLFRPPESTPPGGQIYEILLVFVGHALGLAPRQQRDVGDLLYASAKANNRELGGNVN